MFDTVILGVFVGGTIAVFVGRQILSYRIRKRQGRVQLQASAPLRSWLEYAGQVGAFLVVLAILLGSNIPGTFGDAAFLKVCGAVVFSACVAVHLRAKSDLDANWTNAKEGATVREGPITRHGLYRYSRNPMYTATLGMVFGLVLMTQHVLVVAMWLFVLVYFLRVIKSEERLLAQAKGEPYLAYCREVPRFL